MNVKLKNWSSRLGLLLLLTLCVSCEKYLDVQSNNSLVIPKTLEDLQKLLDNSQKMNRGIGSLGELSADSYFLDQTKLNAQTDKGKLIYVWSNKIYNNGIDWSAGYTPVYICNLVLERLEKIARTAQNSIHYDRVKGTALFGRANQYLSLLWNFAQAYNPQTAANDLGIVLRNSSDMNDKSTRSTVAECYASLLEDLQNSAALLPVANTHIMRPSQVGAYGQLARAYLSMSNYDSAYYYADKVLEINNKLLNYNSPAEVDLSGAVSFFQYNKEILSYYEMTSNDLNFTQNALIDTLLYKSYEVNDLRKQAYFKTGANGYMTFKGNYARASSAWQTLNPFCGVAVDEIYLIRAECLARVGKLQAAQQDLNTLLLTRYKTGSFIPYNLMDQKSVLDLVLEERRKELLFRGVRWIDIKRLNLAGANITLKRYLNGTEYVLSPNANRYALPLPDDIIRLTGIPQNPW